MRMNIDRRMWAWNRYGHEVDIMWPCMAMCSHAKVEETGPGWLENGMWCI